ALANEIVLENIEDAQETYKEYYDRRAKEVNYPLGSWVYLRRRVIIKGLAKKLSNQFEGPYEVIAKDNPRKYKIRKLVGKENETTVHVDRLRPYTKFPGFATERITSPAHAAAFDRLLAEEKEKQNPAFSERLSQKCPVCNKAYTL